MPTNPSEFTIMTRQYVTSQLQHHDKGDDTGLGK